MFIPFMLIFGLIYLFTYLIIGAIFGLAAFFAVKLIKAMWEV